MELLPHLGNFLMSFSHNPVPREWSFIGWVLFQKHSIRHILNFMLIKGLHQVFRRKPYMGVLISGCPNNTYGCPMPENTSIKRTGKTGRTRFLSPMPLWPKYWCPAGWQEFVPLQSVPISKRFSPEHSVRRVLKGHTIQDISEKEKEQIRNKDWE